MAAGLRLLAGALQRAAPRLSGRAAGPLAVRFKSDGGVPTDEEQATGLERKILEADRRGEDPYSCYAPKKYAGTKEDPHLVPSTEDMRFVGCVCDEDTTYINWFWVIKGKVHRCWECGAHYKLVPQKIPH
ncbi:hypothetical protein JRQ81_017295 [Phrynocephalus forsythii]|uniref:Cytochrome c oxidase subunit 5B, mitochondrial n=1 Tax=Phrynocephalus forsythii TaxID=171643 RepID=A0A9Q0XSI1_9SAUR|nr:hypothetical protein JRQ81_017295 [Phrynocephalus forsythii]